jgi:hypothetical protein
LAVFALRQASRRCFLGAIAMLALAIHLFAMAASRGSSAQAIADALLIDAGTSVAFGSVPGAVSGAMDVGTTPDGRLWFHAVLAVQFARGFMNEEHARTLLSKTVQEGDGVPNGFHRGRWKVGDARREGGSGWSEDTSIDADTLRLQVRLRLSACMREHDLSLKHNSILGSQLRKHALFRPLGSPYPTPVSWPADAPPTALPSTSTNAADTEASRVAPREDAAGQEGGTQEPARKRAKTREPAASSTLAASASATARRHSEDGDGVGGQATSARARTTHQSEAGDGEGRGKRARKATKRPGDD